MSKRMAIKHLREALRIAGLPSPRDRSVSREIDSTGRVVAADIAFQLGMVEALIELALAELRAPASKRAPGGGQQIGEADMLTEEDRSRWLNSTTTTSASDSPRAASAPMAWSQMFSTAPRAASL
jgi:hypothetical protein